MTDRRITGLPRAEGTRSRLAGEAGQSAVELVALLPIIAVVAAAGFTVLSSRSAADQAVAAAQAGAMALLQDANPRDAARAALPASVRPRAAIRITGRRVLVTIPASGPLAAVAPFLAASSTADAGPEPSP